MKIYGEKESGKKNLLLIMPFFMGYHNKLKQELQKKYEVTLINSEQFDQEILDEYLPCSKLRWGVRHLFKAYHVHEQEVIQGRFYGKLCDLIEKKRNFYQIIFCINGAYIPNIFYQTLKDYNPNARFIYYAWDDIANLFKNSHIKFFNEKYGYNVNECREKKLTYLPMFVQSEEVGHNDENRYDIMYIASAHSDRKEVASNLYNKYKDKYRLFIYLYDPEHSGGQFCQEKPIDYEEYINIMRQSKALLDVQHIKQEGPTTRAFDALLTKTKVITTNQHIKDYPVYSDNILVVNRDNIEIDEEFMEKSYVDNDYKALTISMWLDEMGL